MALALNRSLDDLRLELAGRLGFSNQSNTGALTAILNSFLRQSQEQLYWQFDWKQLKRVAVLSPGANQRYLDYPDGCNPDRILRMAASGAVTQTHFALDPMVEGIELAHLNSGALTDRPRRFVLRNQIEIWPQTDRNGYTIRMEYIINLNRFAVDGDRLTLDDDALVFMQALANAKAHYRHPDAQIYAGQFNTLLGRVRAREAPRGQFIRGVNNNLPAQLTRPLQAGSYLPT